MSSAWCLSSASRSPSSRATPLRNPLSTFLCCVEEVSVPLDLKSPLLPLGSEATQDTSLCEHPVLRGADVQD